MHSLEKIKVSVGRPQVLSVYPSAGSWPANILRSHIAFSQPMRTANALNYIQLLDDKGIDISDSLLDLPDGLWSADQRILTVLFHPGRVKTGLIAGDRYGPIFAVGRAYRFVVRATICSAQGQPIGSSHSHYFQASPPVEESFSCLTDQLELTSKTTKLNIDRLLDFLSVQAYIAVVDEFGDRVCANISPTADGQFITVDISNFVEGERYLLRLHPRLEDIAGNRKTEAFQRTATA